MSETSRSKALRYQASIWVADALHPQSHRTFRRFPSVTTPASHSGPSRGFCSLWISMRQRVSLGLENTRSRLYHLRLHHASSLLSVALLAFFVVSDAVDDIGWRSSSILKRFRLSKSGPTTLMPKTFCRVLAAVKISLTPTRSKCVVTTFDLVPGKSPQE